jgi:hypothetical protein
VAVWHKPGEIRERRLLRGQRQAAAARFEVLNSIFTQNRA